MAKEFDDDYGKDRLRNRIKELESTLLKTEQERELFRDALKDVLTWAADAECDTLSLTNQVNKVLKSVG